MHERLDCIIIAETPRHARWQYNVEVQEVDEAPLRNQEFIGLKQILMCCHSEFDIILFQVTRKRPLFCREMHTLSKLRVTRELLFLFQPSLSIHVRSNCKMNLIDGYKSDTCLLYNLYSIRLSRILWKSTNWRLHTAWRL